MTNEYGVFIIGGLMYLLPGKSTNVGGFSVCFEMPEAFEFKGIYDSLDNQFEFLPNNLIENIKDVTPFAVADYLNKNYSYQITSVMTRSLDHFKHGKCVVDRYGKFKVTGE